MNNIISIYIQQHEAESSVKAAGQASVMITSSGTIRTAVTYAGILDRLAFGGSASEEDSYSSQLNYRQNKA